MTVLIPHGDQRLRAPGGPKFYECARRDVDDEPLANARRSPVRSWTGVRRRGDLVSTLRTLRGRSGVT